MFFSHYFSVVRQSVNLAFMNCTTGIWLPAVTDFSGMWSHVVFWNYQKYRHLNQKSKNYTKVKETIQKVLTNILEEHGTHFQAWGASKSTSKQCVACLAVHSSKTSLNLNQTMWYHIQQVRTAMRTHHHI